MTAIPIPTLVPRIRRRRSRLWDWVHRIGGGLHRVCCCDEVTNYTCECNGSDLCHGDADPTKCTPASIHIGFGGLPEFCTDCLTSGSNNDVRLINYNAPTHACASGLGLGTAAPSWNATIENGIRGQKYTNPNCLATDFQACVSLVWQVKQTGTGPWNIEIVAYAGSGTPLSAKRYVIFKHEGTILDCGNGMKTTFVNDLTAFDCGNDASAFVTNSVFGGIGGTVVIDDVCCCYDLEVNPSTAALTCNESSGGHPGTITLDMSVFPPETIDGTCGGCEENAALPAWVAVMVQAVGPTCDYTITAPPATFRVGKWVAHAATLKFEDGPCRWLLSVHCADDLGDQDLVVLTATKTQDLETPLGKYHIEGTGSCLDFEEADTCHVYTLG